MIKRMVDLLLINDLSRKKRLLFTDVLSSFFPWALKFTKEKLLIVYCASKPFKKSKVFCRRHSPKYFQNESYETQPVDLCPCGSCEYLKIFRYTYQTKCCLLKKFPPLHPAKQWRYIHGRDKSVIFLCLVVPFHGQHHTIFNYILPGNRM